LLVLKKIDYDLDMDYIITQPNTTLTYSMGIFLTIFCVLAIMGGAMGIIMSFATCGGTH